MKGKKRICIGVQLSQQLYDSLQKKANDLETSASVVVRMALKEFL